MTVVRLFEFTKFDSNAHVRENSESGTSGLEFSGAQIFVEHAQ